MRGHLLVLSVVNASHLFETKEDDEGWELMKMSRGLGAGRGTEDEDYELIAAPTAAADAASEQYTDILFEDGLVLLHELEEMRGPIEIIEPNELTESLQEKIDRANQEFEDACRGEWMVKLQENFDKVTKEFLEANADDKLKEELAMAASEEVCKSINEKMTLGLASFKTIEPDLKQRLVEDLALSKRFQEAYKLRLAEYRKFQENYEADMFNQRAKQDAAIKDARARLAQLKK